MGFGLPWMLVGLIAVAAPILAHLLRRQKLPRQTLPTIAFLHRIHATRAARLRVVDLLLLVLRVLLVLVLVLVAARPYRVVQSSVTDRQHALAIVFDDSLSMSAIHEGSTLIERAASLAKRQLRGLPRGSEVSVVLAGKPPRVWLRRSSEVELATDAFGEIEERSIRANALCDAVRLAVDLLLESDLGERRLVVFSDFTKGAHSEECDWPTRGVSIGFEQVATPNPDNRWIRAVEVTGSRDSDKGLQLEAKVSGTNTTRPQNIRLRRKGQDTQTSPVEWSGKEGVAVLTLPAGSVDAVVEMQLDPDDVLSADNVRGVLLGSDTIHVLLVDGDPHPDPRRRETAFIAQALEVAPQAGRSFAVETLDAQDFSESAIIRSDVVVLANATLDSKWLPLLQRFVSGGGSLWVTAGNKINPRAYGNVLRDLLPGRYTATRTDDGPLSLRSEGLPELAQVTVNGRAPIEETSLDAVVTARFSDGSPAMVEHRYRSGRVAMLATTLDDAWTDLPYQPAFVPFVLQTLARLAGRTEHSVEPFQAVSLPGSTQTQRIQVITPSGRTLDLPQADRVAFRETTEIGAYRVLVNGVQGPRFAFVVNAPSGESDLVPDELPDVATGFDRPGGVTLRGLEEPLTPWLLTLALGLLFADVWLRQVRRR
ncbi:MAG: BatA domain-containing protein [Myxococcales bacterium]|nr:BatA domain-containing protein [Myxococcales bacterium]MDH3483593.1 BatA domain-containing protein [Myxococcales bacterium]